MAPPEKKPAAAVSEDPFSDDGALDDDFTSIDAFGPMEGAVGGFDVSATRVAAVETVSRKTGFALDKDRARALNISMATTLLEPLPTDRVAFVELPGGGVAILSKSVTVLGRAAGVADVVIDDHGVSRQHAAIVYAQGDFFLEDLGSSNGTTIQGERVAVVQLAPGTAFALGRHTCTFKVRAR